MRRRPHEAIALDQSLRQSRAIWLSLAIAVIPIALGGLVSIYLGIAGLFGTSGGFGGSVTGSLWEILIGAIVVTGDVFLFLRTAECSRRLRVLHENPTANVKPLPAPFQSALFGPYH